MKYIIIISLFFIGCKPDGIAVRAESTSIDKIETREYIYDSCQYVKFGTGHYSWGAHKGTCTNSKHKCK